MSQLQRFSDALAEWTVGVAIVLFHAEFVLPREHSKEDELSADATEPVGQDTKSRR